MHAYHDADAELATLLRTAGTGDAEAWTHLVRRFDSSLRHIARSYRLAPQDVDDAVQETWVELLAGIQRIRRPAAVGAWLRTVTRRNALRRRRSHLLEQLTDDALLGDGADVDSPEASVLAAERRAALGAALASLSDRHRRLLTLLLSDPGLDYRQVGEQLTMPVGSIGPTRARALAQLARDPRLRALRH
jgi:RNA polymerase sigma factor (sigma-70 family)